MWWNFLFGPTPGKGPPHDAHVVDWFLAWAPGNTLPLILATLASLWHFIHKNCLLFKLYSIATEKFCQNDIIFHLFSPANLQLLVSIDLFGYFLHWFLYTELALEPVSFIKGSYFNCIDHILNFCFTYVCVCVCRGGTSSLNSFREARCSIPFPPVREEELVLQSIPLAIWFKDAPETAPRPPPTDLLCLR